MIIKCDLESNTQTGCDSKRKLYLSYVKIDIMAGGLIQLVAYGVQDLYLTSDPQITFFKVIYRRHTNFSIESVPQSYSIQTAPSFGQTVTCTLSKLGDLVGSIILFVRVSPVDIPEDFNKQFAWVRYLGYAIIQDIVLEIGGKQVDKQYGEWLYLWEEVSGRQNKGIDKMVGNLPEIYNFSKKKNAYDLYIPLRFWFNKFSGLNLPLIAMASAEVKLVITFRRLEECSRIGPTNSIELAEDICSFQAGDYIEQTINGNSIYGYVISYDFLTRKLFYIKIKSPTSVRNSFESPASGTVNNKMYLIRNSLDVFQSVMPAIGVKEMAEPTFLPRIPIILSSFLYVNYIYLDNDERVKFYTNYHEYLIEQMQFNQKIGNNSPNIKQNLSLSHPCKSLYFVAQLDSIIGTGTINDLFNYTDSHIRYPDGRFYGKDLIKTAYLQLNNKSRFTERTSEYFNYVVPYQCHYRGPTVGINVYTFCFNPEEQQPSGTCNMSRIDEISLLMTLSKSINANNTCRIRNYAINYNILRVIYNLAGLAFV